MDTLLDTQAKNITRIQIHGIVLGFSAGVVLSAIFAVVWHFFSEIVRMIPVWGTLLAIATAGVTLYWFRGRWRLAYGVMEILIGFAIATKVFWPSFDYSQFNTWSFLQVFSGIYVMIRGQDNIGKALQNTKFDLKWKKYSGEK